MNIMSFNCLSRNKAEQTVWNAEQVFADARIEVRGPKLNALLLGEQVDIAGLQELTKTWRNWLYQNLDEAYRTVGSYTKDTGEGGLIIYRDDLFSLIENGVFWLAPGAPQVPTKGWDAKFDRLCAWAIFRVRKSGTYFVFLNTHLDHVGTTARREQAKLIAERVKPLRDLVFEQYGCAECPLILTGDMNSTPDSDVYTIFESVLRDARTVSTGETVPPTAPTFTGFQWASSPVGDCENGTVIDYIFLTENVSVKNFHIVGTTTNLCRYGEYLSDHNAILADVCL